MKSFVRTIKIILIDGIPDGRMVVELSNWTGKAFKIPRNYIAKSEDRDELMNTGLYMLFGKGKDNSDLIYVGEAEQILPRLKSHISGKDFWTHAIVFISKDNNLNKAHVKHLESSLVNLIKNAGKYKLINTNTPTKSSISEAEYAEVEEFLHYVIMLTVVLNYQIVNTTEEQSNQDLTKKTFFISNTKGITAKGILTDEGFLVKQNSKVSKETSESYYKPYLKQRNKLKEQKILIEEGEFFIFTKDYMFKSPSASASIILGITANGKEHWRRADGKLLKEILEND